ncbi:MAG: hypothetical protein QNJ65_24175 [Xenococcaceae cyanobacterium MO_234.B1]|nr:hypothetical protein [Xenococcaceae cyanobacterium MO_234.B1]
MTVKAKIIAINQLLSDIYQQQMRLSYLLGDRRFLPNVLFCSLAVLDENVG